MIVPGYPLARDLTVSAGRRNKAIVKLRLFLPGTIKRQISRENNISLDEKDDGTECMKNRDICRRNRIISAFESARLVHNFIQRCSIRSAPVRRVRMPRRESRGYLSLANRSRLLAQNSIALHALTVH